MPDPTPSVLRLARVAAGMTQEEVGKALGYTKSAQQIIANWESGFRPIPRNKVKPLAKLLKINPVDLLP